MTRTSQFFNLLGNASFSLIVFMILNAVYYAWNYPVEFNNWYNLITK